ncbi:hypothetical protein CSO01_04890 [Cellulomonas soli]|uniref:Uncharacterized protein n=1 Tax=Cellulomonas soli TaxID=931535 RepID=A0A512P994_9CELL|nr:hypothetical protein CSO01_04890 [Cellulomonas soli]
MLRDDQVALQRVREREMAAGGTEHGLDPGESGDARRGPQILDRTDELATQQQLDTPVQPGMRGQVTTDSAIDPAVDHTVDHTVSYAVEGVDQLACGVHRCPLRPAMCRTACSAPIVGPGAAVATRRDG